MGIISSSTIFHFTNRTGLLGILRNGFYPRYRLENYIFNRRTYKLAIPMVSFCDIPLSQIKNHVKQYGSYGIGMAKHWAERNKLNPVLYLKKGSSLSLSYLKLISELKKLELEELESSKFTLREIMQYIKPYEETFEREGITYKFYDEREWRFVPSPSDKSHLILKESEFKNSREINRANKELQKHTLSVEPRDIRYIIVDEVGFTDILQHLQDNGKKNKYDDRIMRILTSKILTYEQIRDDF